MIFNFLENKKTKMKKYELEKSRFLPKINPKDGFIDWNRSAIDLFNFIRSKSIPYPNAFTVYKNIKIEILSSKPINDFIIEKAKAGTIIGKSLEHFTGTYGTIEVVVGKS
jgi:methionyl-tRNA formyltransferase